MIDNIICAKQALQCIHSEEFAEAYPHFELNERRKLRTREQDLALMLMDYMTYEQKLKV